MIEGNRCLIFTDLDGTLLDYRDYSFADALPALKMIRERRVPLIICSSKTAAEIDYYREKLENRHPFISENGGGIFIPKGYFGFRVVGRGFVEPADCAVSGAYEIVRLGAGYGELRKALETLRQRGLPVRGFGDMSAKEVSEVTGLCLNEARMAQKRDFDEPFVLEGDHRHRRAVTEAVEAAGFRYTFGRFDHLTGNSDKGKAVSLLTSMYKTHLGDVTTIGVGDSLNDIPMLQVVDHPVVVQQPDGSYEGDMNITGLIRADGKGPAGWNRVVTDLLTRLL